jgi:hypothetical protein
MVETVYLYYLNEAGDGYLSAAGAATSDPVFKLDASDISIDNGRSTESMEIPGMPWNTWFDNNNINRKWEISGKFAAKDDTWSSTDYTGRSLDFVKQLQQVLNGIKSDGTLNSASQYGFAITINQQFGSTADTYVSKGLYSGQVIRLLLSRFSFKLSGGIPGVVDYAITFDEVGDIINMGI